MIFDNDSDLSDAPLDFIPDRMSKPYIWFFKWYTYWLFRRNFESVYIRLDYRPNESKSTLYFANHHLWWDGLSPLLLNEFGLKQRARAIMENHQMKKYSFFSKIGAFSINRENPRSALFSMNYASKWLSSPGNSLFIYPEGKLTSPGDPVKFEPGIIRIILKMAISDLVPVSYFLNHHNGPKPQLFIHIGAPLALKKDDDKYVLLAALENTITQMLHQQKEIVLSGNTDTGGYSKF